MEIKLSRKLDVICYDAMLLVAKPQKRPDLLAVLHRAHESGRGTNALDICEHLLNNRPARIGQTLLMRCEDLGLLQRAQDSDTERDDSEGILPETTYVPTLAGDLALSQHEVFMPEAGRYRIWLSEDPILADNALISMLAVDEERAQKRGREKATNQTVALPKLLTDLRGKTLTIPGGRGRQRVRIDDVFHEGVKQEPKADLRLNWSLPEEKAGRVSLGGTLGNYELSTTLPAPDLPWRKVWEQLLGKDLQHWVKKSSGYVLLMDFASPLLGDQEKFSMRMTVEFSRPAISGYGEFNDLEVSEVPIAPLSDEDANEWAQWMLEQHIADYMKGNDYSKLIEELGKRFSDYNLDWLDQASFARSLLDRTKSSGEYASRARIPQVYWHLQAPLDLKEEP